MQPATSRSIAILVCDSNQLQSQLLVQALGRRSGFEVRACPMNAEAVLECIETSPVDVAVMNVSHSAMGTDMGPVRRLHLSHPEIAKVLLLGPNDRDCVAEAFRAGVRGLFLFSEHPFRLLCKCIQSVHEGQVWATTDQLELLINALTRFPSLRVVNSHGSKLLTAREEQVVELVADGLSNREIANELTLSEHTIKKYLLHIFEKLGISNRVELVLYALGSSAARPPEWMRGTGELRVS